MSIKGAVLTVIVWIPLLCAAGSMDFVSSYSALEKTAFFGKNKWIVAFLAFLGGVLGLQRWYMGHYKAGLFYVLCTLFVVPAIQFVLRGTSLFPVLFILLLVGYVALEIIGYLKQAKLYLKPFQNMLLGLAFIPLGISLLWIGLLFTFSGRSVYLILFSGIFTLFSLFLAFRYASSNKREFTERFYKNRSIWH